MQSTVQSKLLELVKTRIGGNISYVDELASLLEVSRDSIYRRVRGETELSLQEAVIICNNYGISIQEVIGEESNVFTFHARLVDPNEFNIHQWLESMLVNLNQLNAFPGEKEMVNYTKDLPVFFYFNYPNLSAFKMYFWMRTLMSDPKFQHANFEPAIISQELIALGKRIWQKYSEIPSVEIWSDETIIVTLKQIAFYVECGYFERPSDANILLDEFQEFLNDSKEWMKYGEKPGGAKFEVYRNDILIGDNSILFKLGDNQRISFLTVGMNIFQNSSPRLTRHLEKFYTNLMEKAVLISSTGEKERNRFYRRNQEYLAEIRNRLLYYQ